MTYRYINTYGLIYKDDNNYSKGRCWREHIAALMETWILTGARSKMPPPKQFRLVSRSTGRFCLTTFRRTLHSSPSTNHLISQVEKTFFFFLNIIHISLIAFNINEVQIFHSIYFSIQVLIPPWGGKMIERSVSISLTA